MSSAPKFRTAFKVPKEKIIWYPGHMMQSFRHMQAKMRKMDCVVEVHDSRIPISGRNPAFLKTLVGPKPHILVLNKKDLIDKFTLETIKEKLEETALEKILFTNCLDSNCSGLKQIVPMAIDLIRGGVIEPRENLTYTMMVVGVPNVGKSSLINALRNITCGRGKATKVGAKAGVTRSIQTKIRVSSEPLMYLIDTPGILEPNINDTECGLKLALCSCLNDKVVGMELMADFLLYWMNKTGNFSYVDHFGLSQPIDDVFPLLLKIATDNHTMKKVRNIENNLLQWMPNLEAAANILVSMFRKGKLGDLGLDKDRLFS